MGGPVAPQKVLTLGNVKCAKTNVRAPRWSMALLCDTLGLAEFF